MDTTHIRCTCTYIYGSLIIKLVGSRRLVHVHTYIHTYVHTDIQTDIHTDRQTYIRTYIRTNGRLEKMLHVRLRNTIKYIRGFDPNGNESCNNIVHFVM